MQIEQSTSSIEMSFDQHNRKPPPPSRPPPSCASDASSYWDDMRMRPRSHEDSVASSVDLDDRLRSSTRQSRKSSYVAMGGRESSADVGERMLDSGTLMGSRVLLSGLAIAMLWGSSLTVVTNILRLTNVLPIPPVTVVVDEVISLLNETSRLRQNYLECVRSDLSLCNATLYHRREQEAQRSLLARRANAATRDASRATQASCASSHALALASVAAWQSQQSAGGNASMPSSHYVDSCSDAEREGLLTMTGDTTAQRSAAFQLSRDYSSSSQSTVSQLSEQLAARAAYDREYLYNRTLRDRELQVRLGALGINTSLAIGNHFDRLNISDLVACATLTGGSCPSSEGARAMAEAVQDHLILEYRRAEDLLTTTAARAGQYVTDATRALGAAANTISEMRRLFNRDYPEVNLFGVLNLPPVGASYPFQAVSVPIFDPLQPLDFRPEVDAIDAIARSVAAARDRYQEAFANAVRFANADASFLRDNLVALQLSAFDDYNPPRVDAYEIEEWAARTRDRHREESAHFESDAAVSLDAIDQAVRDSNSSAAFRPVFVSNVSASSLIKAVRDTSWFNYRNLEDAGFRFEWLLQPLRAMSSLLQVLDNVWRIFQTIRILRRFWGRSTLAVQPVDVTTDFESKSRANKLISPMQKLAMLITHPIVLMGTVLVFVFLISGIALSLYYPVFAAYKRDCVARDAQGRPSGDGTVITRNTYALAINYASHSGNRLRLSGLDDYEVERVGACGRYGEKSANDEQRVQADMDAIVGSHTRTQADFFLMRRCYDTNILDAAFAADAPTDERTGEAYPPLGGTLARGGACDIHLDNSSLEEGVFDCSELPECEIACDDLSDENGIDHSELYAYSRTAMCTAQWWFHSSVLRAVFIVAIWIFINMFRVLFLRGVIRLCWQFLNTGNFTFLATCGVDGVHTYKEENLANRVRSMLNRMRLTGALLVLLAVATQVPWCYAIYHFASGLVYDQLA